MTLKKLGFIALSLCASSSLMAAVTMTTPEEIVLVAVNDQEVNSGMFRTAKNQYQVDAGQVSFSVRYQQFFKHLDGEHDVVKSGVVTILAPNLIDGQNYQLRPVNLPEHYEQAKVYAKQPTIGIFDQNNTLVVQQTGANTESKPWLGGAFGRMFDLRQKSAGIQPEPVYGAGPSTVARHSTAVASQRSTEAYRTPQANNSDVAAAKATDQQLIQLWQKASKTERQRFMSWLAEQ